MEFNSIGQIHVLDRISCLINGSNRPLQTRSRIHGRSSSSSTIHNFICRKTGQQGTKCPASCPTNKQNNENIVYYYTRNRCERYQRGLEQVRRRAQPLPRIFTIVSIGLWCFKCVCACVFSYMIRSSLKIAVKLLAYPYKLPQHQRNCIQRRDRAVTY